MGVLDRFLSSKKDDKQEIWDLFDAGKSLMESQFYDRASVEFNKALTLDKDFASELIVDLYMEMQGSNPDAMIALGINILQHNPDNTEMANMLGNTYRNPAHVSKIAATIDTMSEGRFTLAIGAGWYKREHEAYGWHFPTMKERQDRFEEAVALIRLLIHSNDPVDFNGKYYQLDAAYLSPGSHDRPIPIMIGGTGEKRTLRTLARYGDIMNLDGWAGGGMALEYYLHKARVLEKHCEDAGRNPDEIRRTLLMPCYITENKNLIERATKNLGPGTVAGSKQYVIDRIGGFQDAGIAEIMFGGVTDGGLDRIQLLQEEVIPQFQ
mgnify:CR=1 FL=1